MLRAGRSVNIFMFDLSSLCPHNALPKKILGPCLKKLIVQRLNFELL